MLSSDFPWCIMAQHDWTLHYLTCFAMLTTRAGTSKAPGAFHRTVYLVPGTPHLVEMSRRKPGKTLVATSALDGQENGGVILGPLKGWWHLSSGFDMTPKSFGRSLINRLFHRFATKIWLNDTRFNAGKMLNHIPLLVDGDLGFASWNKT